MKNNENYESILAIKNEIIYCIGNCVLGIQDTIFGHGLELLKMAIDQGAIEILTQALDYKTHKTDTLGIKVALDGLSRYFKAFKKAEKSQALEIYNEFHGYFNELTYSFEVSHNGLDILESCQYHQDHLVYKMSQKILVKYFEPDT